MIFYVLWIFIIHNPAQRCTKILMIGYRKSLTLVYGSHDESFRVHFRVLITEELYHIKTTCIDTYTSLNKLYTLSQVIQLIRPWQSALSLYWNLLSKVIHTEIVLLTRREVFLVVKPIPRRTFTVGTKVFSS